MPAKFGSKPFIEAQAYLRNKIPLPTNGWQDVYASQHDQAFSVAGANKTAIVEDFLTAIQAAVVDGETLQDFRKRFDSIVESHGWSYNGERGWRSKLIYETNIRQTSNAGREAQMAEPGFQKLFPYSQYRHSGATHYRPEHKAWDGLTLPANDGFWLAHSPSNGYFCKCKKFPVSDRQLKRLGKTTPDPAPSISYKEHIDKRTGEVKQIPKGIDPGFEYTPNQSVLRQRSLTQHEPPTKLANIPIGPNIKPELPSPTPIKPNDILDDGLTDQQYVDHFMDQFGSKSLVFSDVLGEPLQINDLLFKDAKGELKVSKDNVRHRYMKLLAKAIISPDEVWGILEPDISRPGKYRLKRRFIARWVLETEGDAPNQPVHGFSAFEYGKGLWSGSTSFVNFTKKGRNKSTARDSYLEKQREGVLLYRKDSD